MATISLLPAPELETACPPCLYYYSRKDGKEYIILTPTIDDTDKCFKYDIAKNQWIHFATYPDGLKPECHVSTIDEENDLLYVTHGFNNIFATLNMNTNQWNVMSTNKQEGRKYNIIDNIHNAPSVMLPHSELHIFGKPRMNSIHIRYNKSENKFVTASTDGIENNCYLDATQMVYIHNKKMLMCIGGYSDEVTDKIWVANYTGYDQSNFVWKEFKKKLPHTALPVCTLVFGSVLIVHYDKDSEDEDDENNGPVFMWILDCGGDTSEWVKPLLDENEYPRHVSSLITTKSNHLHWICRNAHCKIHLSKFIPPNIYNKYVNNGNANDDDVKCNQCDGLKEKLRIMETQKTSLQTLIDELLNNHLNEKKQTTQQIDSLRTQLEESKTQITKLNEECKETKLELNEAKQELNQLKRMKPIDLSNYLNWSGDEIVNWMITLENGRYQKYENKLRTVFKDECVNGQAIPFIDKAELKNWGISHFMDRNNMHQHLQHLVSQNDNKKNSYDEGNSATAYI